MYKFWVAVDLDGTLAEKFTSYTEIGLPQPIIVNYVKKLIYAGEDVRIFTARVSGPDPGRRIQELLIQQWCLKHLGVILPVTAIKSSGVKLIIDDLAINPKDIK